MAYMKILILVTITSAISCNDLHLGHKWEGHLIFNETFAANPAIWTREEDLFVDAKKNVIDKIVIEDHRPNKDGVAEVIDGGINFNNVTIHLESPSIFRGYSFSVKVYAVNKTLIPTTDTTTVKPRFTAATTRVAMTLTSKLPVASISNATEISSTSVVSETRSTAKLPISSTSNSVTISPLTEAASTTTKMLSTTVTSVNRSTAKTNETVFSITSQAPISSTSSNVTNEPSTSATNGAWCKLFGCIFNGRVIPTELPATTKEVTEPKSESNSHEFGSWRTELNEDYEAESTTDRTK